jgi:probable addiction module antidote protein
MALGIGYTSVTLAGKSLFSFWVVANEHSSETFKEQKLTGKNSKGDKERRTMTMSKKTVIKHTTSYEDNLVKRLKDSELAQAYLEAALESYQEDKDTGALLLALRDVAKAQGGIGELAKRTGINRQHLYDILAHKHNPRLDNLLNILSALGFRIRLELERQRVTVQS